MEQCTERINTFRINNHPFFVRNNESDIKSLKEVFGGGYERKDFAVLAGESWLDLGGNIGAFSTYAHLRGATCIGYEPDPNNAKLMQQNLTRYGIVEPVRTRAVIFDGPNKLQFFRHPDKPWRNGLYKEHRGGTLVAVDTIRFAEVLTDKITGIKMDIEGAEKDILTNTKDWKQIKKLCFEWHFDIHPFVKDFNLAIEQLSQEFDILGATKKLSGEVYKFFPPAKTIFCVRK